MPTCPKCAAWTATNDAYCDTCLVRMQQERERLGTCVECAKEGVEEPAITEAHLCAAHDVALN